MADVEQACKRFDSLRTQRSNFDYLWQEVAELYWSSMDNFWLDDTSPGQKKTQKQYDMTGALALDKFASIFQSMNVPRTKRWQKLVASDPDLQKLHSVQSYLERITNHLFKMRDAPQSNFYGAMGEAAKSLGAFGNQCIYTYVGKNEQFRYKSCHIGQIYIETNPDGLVDTIYRKYPMTAKAAAQYWGEKDLPEKVKRNLEQCPHENMYFLHVVRPRDDADPDMIGPLGMPFEAFDISLDDKQQIGKDSGYQEMPYHYGRMSPAPTEKYGRGPAMMVLPDNQTLQAQERTVLRAGHKAADPPLLVHDDGVIGSGMTSVDLRPGGLNYGGVDSQGRPMIQPLVSGARPEITFEMQNKKRESINDAHWVNLFQLLVDNPQMTATEVLERAQEKGQLINPHIGRNQDDVIGPMTTREINHVFRVHPQLLADMPQELIEAGGEYDIVYDTPATAMARSGELVGVARTVEMLAPFAAIDPSVFDVLNADEIARLSAEITGTPMRVVRTQEEVAAIRESRAQQQQMQQMAELAPGLAKAAKDADEAGLELG